MTAIVGGALVVGLLLVATVAVRVIEHFKQRDINNVRS